jgi:soluble lytic murein transglycosylase-like protein
MSRIIQPTPLVAAALQEASDATGLDVSILRAIAYVESRFIPTADGPPTASGWRALGLMQLGPAAIKQFAVTDPHDPRQNAKAGARLLAEYLRHYHGSLERAVAAYNWGPGNVDKHPALPGEVQLYVERVIARMSFERSQAGIPPNAPNFVLVAINSDKQPKPKGGAA